MRYLVYIVPAVLLVYALIDWMRNSAPVVVGIRRIWWLLIILLPVLGPIAWIVSSLYQNMHDGPPPRRRGPVAPDDDPEFLWRLSQEARRKREAEKAAASDEEIAPGAESAEPEGDVVAAGTDGAGMPESDHPAELDEDSEIESKADADPDSDLDPSDTSLSDDPEAFEREFGFDPDPDSRPER